jgi:hypothetical protein
MKPSGFPANTIKTYNIIKMCIRLHFRPGGKIEGSMKIASGFIQLILIETIERKPTYVDPDN